MKATVLYRTASILLFVAAAGNAYAVVRFWQAAGAMNPVPLPEDHRLSYGPVVLALGPLCAFWLTGSHEPRYFEGGPQWDEIR
jgi:hypothetical protein